MHLRRALIGALIGSMIGVGVLIGIHMLTGVEQGWLAVLVALMTGLGVRLMVSTRGHASIVRGALTCALALLTYMSGTFLAAGVLEGRSKVAIKPTGPSTAKQVNRDVVAGEDRLERPPIDLSGRPVDYGDQARLEVKDRPLSNMDLIWLAVAALVAYELGRGVGQEPSTTEESAPDDEEGQPTDDEEGPPAEDDESQPTGTT
jgi:hypothetical protein